MGRPLHGIVKMKLAIAVVAAVSITGIAAAGAVVSTGSGPTLEDASTTTTTVAPDDPTTTTTTEAAPVPAEDPTTTTTVPVAAEPAAAPSCETHGQRVSRVAHDTPPGPGHGAAVSAAAHDHTGECGTDEVDGVAPPLPAAPTVGDDESDDGGEHAPEAEAPDDDGGHGHGGGNSGGHGHGDD